MPVWTTRRRFTVEEYHRMVHAGIFQEDDRIELLEGEVVEMTPIGSRHSGCVNRLTRLLSERSSGRALVSVQNPIRLAEHSEPQPDVALLTPRPDYYGNSHPEPGDILLLIEVTETSESYDRAVKVPLYARYGVQEVWLVDLAEDVVVVYRQPGRVPRHPCSATGRAALHRRSRRCDPGVLPGAGITRAEYVRLSSDVEATT